MAFAPSSTYYNTGDGSILGRFTEKDCGNYFEYSMADDYEEYPATHGKIVEFPHKIWVTTPRENIDRGYRRGLVLKTCAYIVVDEDENGPVIEKWQLKENVLYGTDWSRPLTPGQQLIEKLAF